MGTRTVVMLRGFAYGAGLLSTLWTGLWAFALLPAPWLVLVIGWGCWEIGMSLSRWQYRRALYARAVALAQDELERRLSDDESR